MNHSNNQRKKQWDAIVRQLHRRWANDNIQPQQPSLLRGLIVDTDSKFRQPLQFELSRNGFQMLSCSDIDRASAALLVRKFNFLIIDLSLISDSKVDSLDRIPTKQLGMKLLPLRNDALTKAHFSIFKNFDLIVKKPIDPDYLTQLITKIVQGFV